MNSNNGSNPLVIMVGIVIVLLCIYVTMGVRLDVSQDDRRPSNNGYEHLRGNGGTRRTGDEE